MTNLTPTSDLSGLLGRVEVATGPDREIDGLLWARFDEGPTVDPLGFGDGRARWRDFDSERAHRECSSPLAVVPRGMLVYLRSGALQANSVFPFYTASLDAALGLCERVLPGRGWEVRHNTNVRRPVGTIYEPEDPAAGILDPWPPRYESLGATPALALLAAMLKSLVAQGEAGTAEHLSRSGRK